MATEPKNAKNKAQETQLTNEVLSFLPEEDQITLRQAFQTRNNPETTALANQCLWAVINTIPDEKLAKYAKTSLMKNAIKNVEPIGLSITTVSQAFSLLKEHMHPKHESKNDLAGLII